MGVHPEYLDKYLIMKQEYLSGKSLSKVCREYKADRGSFSKRLKQDGIEIINKQNLVKVNECYFDEIDCQEKAYWLGFLYADGAISSKSNCIELSLSSRDVEHVRKFQRALEYSGDRLFLDDVRCRFEFCSKHMKETLISRGCFPRKSLTLKFPTESQLNYNFLFDFIRGYVDGDGSVMVGKNHRGERVVPRLSILGTYDFLNNLMVTTKWNHVKISHPSGCYSAEWGGRYVKEYIVKLYENATVYLDRKYQKYLEIKSLPTINRGKNLEG